MRARTAVGVVSGFTALLTSTLGGSALACTHPAEADGLVVSADAARTAADFRVGLAPAKETARLEAYAAFTRQAIAAMSAKAGDVADELSTAADKDAAGKLLTHAGAARAGALGDLAAARQSLAGADAALSAGHNSAALRLLRTTWAQLRQAGGRLAIARMVAGTALRDAYVAARAARLAKADAVPVDAPVVSLDPGSFDGRHHCDGSGFGDGAFHHDGYRHDGYRDGGWDAGHDGYHRDWHR